MHRKVKWTETPTEWHTRIDITFRHIDAYNKQNIRKLKKKSLIVVVRIMHWIVSLDATAFILPSSSVSSHDHRIFFFFAAVARIDLRSLTQIIMKFFYCIDISFIENHLRIFILNNLILLNVDIVLLCQFASRAKYALVFLLSHFRVPRCQ